MRSTVRLDDDLMIDLKERARIEKLSVSRLLNKVVRAGLGVVGKRRRNPPFRETTHTMGTPRLDLTRALTLVAKLEDEGILAKLALRK